MDGLNSNCFEFFGLYMISIFTYSSYFKFSSYTLIPINGIIISINDDDQIKNNYIYI